jgi:N-acetylglucosamine-6-phosphate deacetylase
MEVGRDADLIVLDQNLEQLHTMAFGEVIHGRR